MSTTYEVRRGKHVVTTSGDAAYALSFAKLHSHFHDQLQVYAVERREYLITEPPAAAIPIRGAAGLRAGRPG